MTVLGAPHPCRSSAHARLPPDWAPDGPAREEGGGAAEYATAWATNLQGFVGMMREGVVTGLGLEDSLDKGGDAKGFVGMMHEGVMATLGLQQEEASQGARQHLAQARPRAEDQLQDAPAAPSSVILPPGERDAVSEQSLLMVRKPSDLPTAPGAPVPAGRGEEVQLDKWMANVWSALQQWHPASQCGAGASGQHEVVFSQESPSPKKVVSPCRVAEAASALPDSPLPRAFPDLFSTGGLVTGPTVQPTAHFGLDVPRVQFSAEDNEPQFGDAGPDAATADFGTPEEHSATTGIALEADPLQQASPALAPEEAAAADCAQVRGLLQNLQAVAAATDGARIAQVDEAARVEVTAAANPGAAQLASVDAAAGEPAGGSSSMETPRRGEPRKNRGSRASVLSSVAGTQSAVGALLGPVVKRSPHKA